MAAQPDPLRAISDARIQFLTDESNRFIAALNTVADELRAKAINLLSDMSPASAAKTQAIVSLQRELQGQLNRIGYEDKVKSFIGEYDASQKFALETLKALNLPAAGLSRIDQSSLAALKASDYTYLVSVGGSTIQAVATGVVRNTLTGTPRSSIIDNIASTLDVGLRGRAATYADTALVSYDRRTAMAHWEAAGIKLFLYRGPKDIKNREFCEKYVGQVFNLAQIKALDDELVNYSKKPLLPCLVFGGGWNCRHVFTPVAADTAHPGSIPPKAAGPAAAAPRVAPEPPAPMERLTGDATHAERLAAAKIPADLVLKAYDHEGNLIGYKVSGSSKVYANTGSAGKEAKRILHEARPELRPGFVPPPPPPPPVKPLPPPPPPPPPPPVVKLPPGRLPPGATHEARLANAAIPADLIDKVFNDAGALIGYRVSGVDVVYSSSGAAGKVARNILHQARPDLEKAYRAKKALLVPPVPPLPTATEAKPTVPPVSPAAAKRPTGLEMRKRLTVVVEANHAAYQAAQGEYWGAVRKLEANQNLGLVDKLTQDREAARAVMKKARILSEDNGVSLVAVHKPAQFAVTMHVPTADDNGKPIIKLRQKEIQATWQKGIDLFSRLVGPGYAEGKWVGFVQPPRPPKGERPASFYKSSTMTVSMRLDAEADVVVHELGHWLESQNRGFAEKMEAFLVKRTTLPDGTREPKVRLNQLPAKIGGNKDYNDHEVTRKDRFENAYTGKVYESVDYANYDRKVGLKDKVNATEIGSMGLQQMAKDPLSFAKSDPEFFDLIWETIGNGGT